MATVYDITMVGLFSIVDDGAAGATYRPYYPRHLGEPCERCWVNGRGFEDDIRPVGMLGCPHGGERS